MTTYEKLYIILQPFLAQHYKLVRKALKQIVPTNVPKLKLLDIGGRKSNYTVGINVDVDIIDLPRESEVQIDTKLGLSSAVIDEVKQRRSNISNIFLGNIKEVDLPSAPYDIITSVEVIEHDPEPERHLKKLASFLKKDGFLVLTTPNGTAVQNAHPDHFKEYTAEELYDLLIPHFEDVKVSHQIKRNFFFFQSYTSWYPITFKSFYLIPWVFFCTVIVNFINYFSNIDAKSAHTLLAIASKPR